MTYLSDGFFGARGLMIKYPARLNDRVLTGRNPNSC